MSPRRPLRSLAVLACALSSAVARAQTWQHVVQIPGDDVATWAVSTSDGGFGICGVRSEATLLVRLAAGGEVAWATVLEGALAARVAARADELVIGGETSADEPGFHLYWAGTGPNGVLLEAHAYRGSRSDALVPRTGMDANGSGYVLAGAQHFPPSIARAAELVAVDGAGVPLAMREYADARYGAQCDALYESVRRLPNGFACVGSTGVDGDASTRDALVAVLDATGAVVWCRTYSSAGFEDEARGIDVAANGDLLVCGRDAALAPAPSSDASFVLRLDALGVVRWRAALPDFACTASIEERANGEIVVAGTSQGRAALADLDANGALVWARAYGSGTNDAAAAAVPTSDGGLFLAATSRTGFDADFLAIRTDAQGRVGCDDVEIALVASPSAPDVADVPWYAISDLGSHPIASETISAQFAVGVACTIVRVTSGCAGDGTLATACPCGNSGGAGRGCASSVSSIGALLDSSGTTTPDTLVLSASGMPAIASLGALFFQGDAFDASGVVFGDGVRCAGGNLVRLDAKPTHGGVASFPELGDPSVSTRGGVVPGSGDVRHYQAYYRNASASFCPPATFNATNALSVIW